MGVQPPFNYLAVTNSGYYGAGVAPNLIGVNAVDQKPALPLPVLMKS